VSYEEFLAHFKYNQTATLLREVFAQIDKDKSGKLSKQEIINAIKVLQCRVLLKAFCVCDVYLLQVKKNSQGSLSLV